MCYAKEWRKARIFLKKEKRKVKFVRERLEEIKKKSQLSECGG
jgi:hypothetical protein